MRIVLIAAGTRQPQWVQAGFQEYARRLRGSCTLELVEIPLGWRTSSGSARHAVEQEAERILRAIPRGARAVALDVDGKPWSTAQLAGRMPDWMAGGAPVCLLVGGPDGLSSRVMERADERWSLSPLTLPHGLVAAGRRSPVPGVEPQPGPSLSSPLNGRLAARRRLTGGRHLV